MKLPWRKAVEPPPPETRASYSKTITQAIWAAINAAKEDDATATAAGVFGIGLIARCFMACQPSLPYEAFGPQSMAGIARQLLLSGNYVAAIELDGADFRLLQSAEWDVTGSPRRWRYSMNIPGPTASDHLRLAEEEVIHIRLNPDPARPWHGVSPLTEAGLTASLIARIEKGLGREAGITSNLIVQSPPSAGLAQSEVETLIANLEANERGYVVQGASPSARTAGDRMDPEWATERIGFNPPATSLAAREQVQQDILSALGIPAGLFTQRDGAVSREAYRQLLVATVQPLAKLIAEELSRKIMPVNFTFHALAAADVRQRAGAWQTLQQANAALDPADRLDQATIRELTIG